MKLSSLRILWAYAAESPVVQLYIASVALLAFGLVYEAWRRSVRMTFINDVSLQKVEKTHPHLPSARMVMAILLCCSALMLAALRRFASPSPLHDPATWITLAAVFILGGSMAILGELRWKRAREFVFAFIAGCATALLLITAWGDGNTLPDMASLWLMMSLLCAGGVAVRSVKTWHLPHIAIAGGAFILWIFLAW